MKVMATPLKPWERANNAASTPRSTSASGFSAPQFSLSSRTPSSTTTTGATSTTATVPSIPPRSGTTGYLSSQPYMTGYGGLGGYGGGYSSYGGGYGSYGGGYGYGYRPYAGGMYGNVESPFLQQAEESTRSAFQSVESVVGAVSSISAMLESTYFAVHSCFRAVLGVAQHFTRLRNYVWGIISAVALLHRLRYWLRKLLRLLRFWRNAERQEDIWEETALEQNRSLLASSTTPSTRVWPAVLFFAIVFGVPWLLWKLLSALAAGQEGATTDSWCEEADQAVVTARALYDFAPRSNDELAFSAGDELVLAPRQLQSGWVLAGKDRKSGLIPVNYIQIMPPSSSNARQQPDSRTPPTTTPPNNSSPPARRQQLHEEETLLND